ncbi:hypothetical protein BD324DRAFT_303544 [Kockovaella imperatae]|uniref:Uncharacterized protein n=1 Tax=Kockovaella imperatae TaxID=4999 RepID=A0A1Y1ULS3_9TREE|nr:hypothetical protein BD324DRAFT_303544 [Kockovaella imperatae]ORX38998.1 hypothetical protein BD324DRAFT_303544 [Kockovaella imperatae]
MVFTRSKTRLMKAGEGSIVPTTLPNLNRTEGQVSVDENKLSSRPVRSLPLEIMNMVVTILYAKNEMDALANLSRLNNSFYDLVTPRLYHVVRLSDSVSFHLFLSSREALSQRLISTGIGKGKSRENLEYPRPREPPAIEHLEIHMAAWTGSERLFDGIDLAFIAKQYEMDIVENVEKKPFDISTLFIRLNRVCRASFAEFKRIANLFQPLHFSWRADDIYEHGSYTDMIAFQLQWMFMDKFIRNSFTYSPRVRSVDMPLCRSYRTSSKTRRLVFPDQFRDRISDMPKCKIVGFFLAISAVSSLNPPGAVHEDPRPTYILCNFAKEEREEIKKVICHTTRCWMLDKTPPSCHFIEDRSLSNMNAAAWRDWLEEDYWGDSSALDDPVSGDKQA